MTQTMRRPRLRPQDLERLKQLRLLDDDFMSLVFDGNIEGTELLLNIFFDRTDMVVTEVVGQREIKNPNGRSVRLDIQALDSTGKVYDIEVQRADKGAVAQRARFNSSMLDTRLLKPGEDYAKLVDTYVIFITEHDVLGCGLPLYHIHRKIEETNTCFGDGSHILYVNGAYTDHTTPIGRLMHDFRCTQPEDMHYPLLANRAQYFKEQGGGQSNMCRIVEEIAKELAHEVAQEYAQELAQDMAQDMAQNMAQDMAQNMAQDMAQNMAQELARENLTNMALSLLADDLPIAFVVKHTGLSEETVRALAAKQAT